MTLSTTVGVLTWEPIYGIILLISQEKDLGVAIKKSQLYASLWQSCDELRGGIDASQYKDYILTLLFMKYVSDKADSDPDSLIIVPDGGGFTDMVNLKDDKEIGDKINKIICINRYI